MLRRTRIPAVAAVPVAGVLGLALVAAPIVAAVVAPAAVGLLLLVLLVRGTSVGLPSEEERRLIGWTVGSLLFHLGLGIAMSRIGATLFFTGSDAVQYHSGAAYVLAHWDRGFPLPDLPSGKEGFFYLLAALYRVFGVHVEAGLAVNAAMTAALVPLMSDATRRLFGDQAAKRVPALVVLLPGFFLWTAPLLREAGVFFLIAIALNAAVRLGQRLAVGALMALTSSLALLFTFRGNVALVVTGGLIAGIALSKRQLIGGVGISVSGIAIVAVLVVGLGLGYRGYKVSVESDLKQVNVVRSDLATANTGIAPDADVSTTRSAITFLPFGLTSFLLGPFPWQIRSVRQLGMLPDAVAWWLLIPALLRGVIQGFRDIGRRMLVVMLPASVLSVVLALLIGNFGTILRERLQVVLLLVPVVALGMAARGQRPAPKRAAVATIEGLFQQPAPGR